MALERFSIVWPPVVVGLWLTTFDVSYLPVVVAPMVLFHRSVAREMRAVGTRFVPFLWRLFSSGRAVVTPYGR